MTRTASQIGKGANKYRAQKTVVDGITFDSKKEAKRWCELRLLEKAGHIMNLERQHAIWLTIGNTPIKKKSKGYPNGRRVKWIADFVYFEGTKRIYEDTKGFRTREGALKIAIVEAMHPHVEVRLT